MSDRLSIQTMLDAKTRERDKLNIEIELLSQLLRVQRVRSRPRKYLLKQELAPDTIAFKAREVLQREGRPMQIQELAVAIGQPNTRSGHAAVIGVLVRLIKKGRIFTRPAKGFYGLAEEPAEETA